MRPLLFIITLEEPRGGVHVCVCGGGGQRLIIKKTSLRNKPLT